MLKQFDSWLFRVLGVLACLWLAYHLKPQPMVTLTTPTQTVVRQYAGLPPVMEAPSR